MDFWTEERIARLKELWSEGHSANEIADALGAVSRSAIIGKAHRLGLPGHVVVHRRKISRKRKPNYGSIGLTAPKVKPGKPVLDHNVVARMDGWNRAKPLPVEKPAKTAAPEPRRLTILQLESNDCRWPVTDALPHLFCGHPSVEDRPYCSDHCDRAYNLGTAR